MVLSYQFQDSYDNSNNTLTINKMTKEQALKVAASYGLEAEVTSEINSGLTPEQALYEWDL